METENAFLGEKPAALTKRVIFFFGAFFLGRQKKIATLAAILQEREIILLRMVK